MIRNPSVSQLRNPEAVNTPTAYTIGAGAYAISFFAYNLGGIEFKSFVGLHEHFYFGISFDMQYALGSGRVRPNIPGVVAKIMITEGFTYFPGIAVGYDSFYEGTSPHLDQESSLANTIINGPSLAVLSPQYYVYKKEKDKDLFNDYNRMIYGPYLALTTPIYLFNSEQYISYGFRFPVQPYFNMNDTSYFLAIDVPLGEFFRIKTELERVFWNFRDPDEWLINFGFRFTFLEQLSIEFDIILEPGEILNRVLKIEYRGEF